MLGPSYSGCLIRRGVSRPRGSGLGRAGRCQKAPVLRFDRLQGPESCLTPTLCVLTKPGKVGEAAPPGGSRHSTGTKVGAGGNLGLLGASPTGRNYIMSADNQGPGREGDCHWLPELSLRAGPKPFLMKSRSAMHRWAENVLATAGTEWAGGETCGSGHEQRAPVRGSAPA